MQQLIVFILLLLVSLLMIWFLIYKETSRLLIDLKPDKQRWMSGGFVTINRERWRIYAGAWTKGPEKLGDQPLWLTSRDINKCRRTWELIVLTESWRWTSKSEALEGWTAGRWRTTMTRVQVGIGRCSPRRFPLAVLTCALSSRCRAHRCVVALRVRRAQARSRATPVPA